MIITIFGATGQVGIQTIHLALAKGYTVKAFGRNVDTLIDKDLRTDNFIAIKGYVFDEKEVMNAIKSSDAVISCLGGNIDGTDRTRSLGMKNIIAQMQKLDCKRIIAIGGLGVLDDEDGKMILDNENYPEEFKPVGLEHVAVLQMLNQSLLDYTFVCPPTILNKEAEERYVTNITYPPIPNKFEVNAGNIAHCMLDAIANKKFIKQKIGISNK